MNFVSKLQTVAFTTFKADSFICSRHKPFLHAPCLQRPILNTCFHKIVSNFFGKFLITTIFSRKIINSRRNSNFFNLFYQVQNHF